MNTVLFLPLALFFSITLDFTLHSILCYWFLYISQHCRYLPIWERQSWVSPWNSVKQIDYNHLIWRGRTLVYLSLPTVWEGKLLVVLSQSGLLGQRNHPDGFITEQSHIPMWSLTNDCFLAQGLCSEGHRLPYRLEAGEASSSMGPSRAHIYPSSWIFQPCLSTASRKQRVPFNNVRILFAHNLWVHLSKMLGAVFWNLWTLSLSRAYINLRCSLGREREHPCI